MSVSDENFDGMLAYYDAISRHAAGEDMRSDPNWPLPSFDARDWAKAFMDACGKAGEGFLSEEVMTAWFANALMRGYDEHARRTSSAVLEQLRKRGEGR